MVQRRMEYSLPFVLQQNRRAVAAQYKVDTRPGMIDV